MDPRLVETEIEDAVPHGGSPRACRTRGVMRLVVVGLVIQGILFPSIRAAHASDLAPLPLEVEVTARRIAPMREPTELRARGAAIRSSSSQGSVQQGRDVSDDRNRGAGRGLGFDLVLDRFRFERR